MSLPNYRASPGHPRPLLRAHSCGFITSSALPAINAVKLLLLLSLLFTTTGQVGAEYAAEEVSGAANGVAHGLVPPGELVDSTTGRDAINGVVSNNINNNDAENADDESNPSEIQKAVCTVTAGEVRASAEAVTTKTLKGVCGSAEMNLALRNLEHKLHKELQQIKLLLQQTFNEPRNPENALKEQLPTTPTSTTELPLKTKQEPFKFQLINSKTKQSPDGPTGKTKSYSPNIISDNARHNAPHLKSLSRSPENLREHEISKFNNTMLTDRDFKVFTYYWKLENFTEHIASDESHTIESPIFSIKGKPLHIKAFFNHLHRDFLYLQLEYAALNTISNKNNIILDTGGLFKEITNDEVLFKHKITILDQSNQRSKDLVSQEFINLETGFLIPNSALLSSPYVKHNSILIQIFLYL